MINSIKTISLVPSATEIVYALGFKNCIVGRSHECDFPSDLQDIPICTRSFVDSNANSKKIDDEVKYRLINELSIYQLDLDLISKLNPHLIITQSQCNVCAIDVDLVRKNFESLIRFRNEIKIVTLKAKDLESIFEDIQTIADALQDSSKGVSLITRMKREINALHSNILSASYRPTVACIEWIDPLMAAGNWVPCLVELAGGENLFSAEGKRSPWITTQDLLSKNPDIIIIMACGFNIDRTIQEMEAFFEKDSIHSLKAIKNKQLFIVDANHFFVRPGPRIVDSLRILCEILHPNEFQPTYREIGWKNFFESMPT